MSEGTESVGTESVGTESVGTESVGTESVGTEPHWRDGMVETEAAEGEVRAESGPDERLEAFWAEASTRARLDFIGAYAGPTVLGSLRPPAWAFGATPEQADELLA